MINQSLEAYSADRIGSFDFVLENAGGSVMLDRCSSTYSHSVAQLSLFGFSFYHYPSSPKVIIQVRGLLKDTNAVCCEGICKYEHLTQPLI